MKKVILFVTFWVIVFCTLISSMKSFAEFQPHDQILRELKESGHIPQGLKKSPYHRLEEVIPKELIIKIKRSKKKLKSLEKGSPPEGNESPSPSPTPLKSSLIPTVYAASKKKNDLEKQIPQKIDLRSFDSPIREQWDGTCTAHGLIAGIENLYNRKSETHLSTRYFWSLYKKYDAEVAVSVAEAHAQLDEKYWPQDRGRAKSRDVRKQIGPFQLNQSEFLENDIQKAIQALSESYPVYIAMSVPQDLAACRATIRPTTGVTQGGHAMVIVGYILDESVPGGGYFILKNSWGTDCGDQGYHYLPFSLCDRSKMYCFFWSLKGVI